MRKPALARTEPSFGPPSRWLVTFLSRFHWSCRARSIPGKRMALSTTHPLTSRWSREAVVPRAVVPEDRALTEPLVVFVHPPEKEGHQLGLPSRNATRSRGWRSRIPPPQKLTAASICSPGGQTEWRSMTFRPKRSPRYRFQEVVCSRLASRDWPLQRTRCGRPG